MNEVVVFPGPEAGLGAAAVEVAASVAHLVKLIAGLNGAIQCARLDGLCDDEIAGHFSALSAAPTAVRAALAADGDGAAMRLLIASLVAAPETSSPEKGTGREIPERMICPMGWG